jgi:tetratricopeptide (TPR) repeat protein
MLNKNMSRLEIEEKLKDKGDFIQIDYLTRLLKQNPPLQIKRFVYNKLAEIYYRKNMFADSGRMFENLAESSITFSDKIKYYTKASESYIELGNFENSDSVMKKAFSNANFQEKKDIYYSIKNFYFKTAEKYEKKNKINSATIIYEKLINMELTLKEKREIKEKLMNFYSRLGRFRDYGLLKGLE